MYLRSEDKDINIKKIERIMKQSSVDCYLNRMRNILKRKTWLVLWMIETG